MEPKEDENKAKFPSIDDIVLQAQKSTSKGELEGKNVLVSAGGTYEGIDPIRGITNRSSGKMGLELAKEAFRRGADVTMVTGRIDVDVPKVFNHIRVESTQEMHDELQKILIDFDVFLSAAAVSDFTLKKQGSKISSQNDLTINLTPATKIINQIKEYSPEIFLVGFKADYNISEDELIKSAKKRMKESGADLMVANDVSEEGAGFGSDQNKVILIDDEIRRVPLSTKEEISALIMDRVIEKLI